jgi:hypothetical protein
MSNFLPSHLLSFFFSKYLRLLVFIRGGLPPFSGHTKNLNAIR